MTENLASTMPSDKFSMHQQSDSISAATVTASLTSELIHASFVAATQSQQSPQTTQYINDTSNNTCGNRIINNSNSNSKKFGRSTSCVFAPTMSNSSLATIEYSIHVSPRRMTRDLATVFPNKDLSNLLIVPTFQKCKYEMVAWDAEIAKEKDDRLDDFIRWSTALHHGLEKLGYWSDMTDPASGFPSFSERGRDVYPDVEGCQLLLKYDFQNAGCCKVLLHPNWGSKIYPATFFTTAPLDALLKVLAQVEEQYMSNPLGA
ncbi:hypothetical protein BGZ46_007185 [Entomortierella lignicola]|nr:hypothetical protein BGZ46_007185 [Entomortierella lignicola]